MEMNAIAVTRLLATPMQASSRVDKFQGLFWIFLGLGTIIGVVVIAYTLYNAYKYRDDGTDEPDEDLPELGELPTGGGKGKKLFVSFGLSAIIVISLVVGSYSTLMYVESGPDGEAGEDAIEVDVTGQAYFWAFEYDNGVETSNELVVPEDTTVWLNVTSADVWHTFGVSELRVKADAIPGDTNEAWFIADEEGEYTIECFELCGPGHTSMEGTVRALPQDEYDQWMDEQESELEDGGDS